MQQKEYETSILEKVLDRIKTIFIQIKFKKSPKLFICYPWVTEEDLKIHPEWKEYDLKDRVLKLHAWLGKAGFKVHLDRKSNDIEIPLDEMMKRISKADFVLTLLTPVFLAKCNDSDKMFTREYHHLKDRISSKELGQPRGIHMYQLGGYKESVPDFLSSKEQNILIRALPKNELECLKCILKNLIVTIRYYGHDKDIEKTFESIWDELTTKKQEDILQAQNDKTIPDDVASLTSTPPPLCFL